MPDIIADTSTTMDANTEVENPEIADSYESLIGNIDKFVGGNQEEEQEEETPAEPEEKPAVVKTPADEALERVAAKEADARKLLADVEAKSKEFEANRKNFVSLKEFDENPHEALTKSGLDPDFIMKKILFHKLPDDNPVKAKLKTELADYLRDKQISDLKKEIEAKEKARVDAEEGQRYYNETQARINTLTSKLKAEDDKAFPTLSLVGKKEGADAVVRDLVIAEMVKDAREKYFAGDASKPIEPEEAASRVEKLLAKLAPYFAKNEAAKKNVVQQKKLVPKEPIAKGSEKKSTAQEIDDLISGVMSGKL